MSLSEMKLNIYDFNKVMNTEKYLVLVFSRCQGSYQ